MSETKSSSLPRGGLMFGIIVQQMSGKPYFYCRSGDIWRFETMEEAAVACNDERKAHTSASGFPTFTPKKISQRFCRQWRATKNQDYVESITPSKL
jgi:hypothetical protein